MKRNKSVANTTLQVKMSASKKSDKRIIHELEIKLIAETARANAADASAKRLRIMLGKIAYLAEAFYPEAHNLIISEAKAESLQAGPDENLL